MAKTSTQIILTLGDAVKSAITSPSEHPISDLDNLIDGDAIRSVYYATYEPDQWLLDGNTHIMAQPASVGFVGINISNALRNFGGSNPEFTLTLDAAVDIEQGITFEFSEISDDYCDSIYIELRNSGGGVVHSETFSPDDYRFFYEPTSVPVASIKFVYVRFLSTSRAYRHARLLDIFIDGVVFSGSEIKSANIIEEIDPISATLPSNNLDFAIYSESAEFSILNPTGLLSKLQEDQKVDVYEYIDGVRNYMGRFYLKEWDAKTANIMNVSAVDVITLLDEIDFAGTSYIGVATYMNTANIDADDLLDEIMGNVSFSYSLDATLQSVSMNGAIFKGSVREALSQYCFALNAYATTARSSAISILPASIPTTSAITLSQSDLSSKLITLAKEVLNVELNYWNFTTIDTIKYNSSTGDDDPTVEIFSDTTLATGDYIFYMDNIIQEYDQTGTATITSKVEKPMFYSFTCSVTGTFSLKSFGYYQMTRSKYRVNAIEDGVITIKSPAFIMGINAYDDIADFVYDWYQQRYLYTFRTFGRSEKAGDQIYAITSDIGKRVLGTITKAEINLISMVSTLTMRGDLSDVA